MKRLVFCTLITCSFGSVFVAAQFLTRNEFMSAEQAKRRWGSIPFEANKFKAAENNVHLRAEMAADLVAKQSVKGFDRAKIRFLLGKPTGYYFSDTIYAYIIEPYTESVKEAWQLVLIPDDKLETIKEIKIHKKCCYKEPAWVR